MAMNAVAAVALPLYCAPVMVENTGAFPLNIACWQVHAMFSMAVVVECGLYSKHFNASSRRTPLRGFLLFKRHDADEWRVIKDTYI
jgi:hypothetical protein